MHKLATKTKTIRLIRHTKVKDSSICYGQMDVELDQTDFDQQSNRLKSKFKDIPVIYSSPSKRCIQLAKTLSDNVIIIDELLEMSFGDWQGLPWDKVDRNQIDQWARDVRYFQIPNGESCNELFIRAKKGLDKLPSDSIVITHAGIIRAALFWSNEQNFEQASQFTVEHAHSYTIKLESDVNIDT